MTQSFRPLQSEIHISKIHYNSFYSNSLKVIMFTWLYCYCAHPNENNPKYSLYIVCTQSFKTISPCNINTEYYL